MQFLISYYLPYQRTSSDECLFQLFRIYSRLIFHQISYHFYIIIFQIPLICMINCLRNVSTVHPCGERGNLNNFIVHSYLINQSVRAAGQLQRQCITQKSLVNLWLSKGWGFFKLCNTTPNCWNPKSSWALQRYASHEALSPFGQNSAQYEEVCLATLTFFRWKGLWVKWSCWSIVGQFGYLR